jgi:hypothetical protein
VARPDDEGSAQKQGPPRWRQWLITITHSHF